MALSGALTTSAEASGAVALLMTLLSLSASLISLFLKHCLSPGEIFGRYWLYLNAVWIKSRRKPARRWRKLLKPVGLCVYCYGTWVAIGLLAVVLATQERPPGIGVGLWFVLLPLGTLGLNFALIKTLSGRLSE